MSSLSAAVGPFVLGPGRRSPWRQWPPRSPRRLSRRSHLQGWSSWSEKVQAWEPQGPLDLTLEVCGPHRESFPGLSSGLEDIRVSLWQESARLVWSPLPFCILSPPGRHESTFTHSCNSAYRAPSERQACARHCVNERFSLVSRHRAHGVTGNDPCVRRFRPLLLQLEVQIFCRGEDLQGSGKLAVSLSVAPPNACLILSGTVEPILFPM